LKQERFEYTKKQIHRALTFLVGRGLVIVKKYNQQEEFYQAGPEQAAKIDAALEQLTATLKEADGLNGLDKKKMLAPRAFIAWERGEREMLSGRFYKMATWLVGLNWLLTLLKLNFSLKW